MDKIESSIMAIHDGDAIIDRCNGQVLSGIQFRPKLAFTSLDVVTSRAPQP